MRSILVVLALALAVGYVVHVETRLSRLELELHAMKTEWTSNGTRYHVTTTRIEGESIEEWQSRHFAEVKARQLINPPT